MLLGKGSKLSKSKRDQMLKAGKLLATDSFSFYLYKLFNQVIENNSMTGLTLNSADLKEYLLEDGIESVNMRRNIKTLIKQTLNLFMESRQ